MKFSFVGIPVSSGCKESKDGKKFYDISIDCEGELVTLGAGEEVYNAFQNVKYRPCNFVGSYQKGEFNGRTYTRISVLGLSVQK